MIPQKAYILKIDDPISDEYSKTAAESCDRVGFPWEYFVGIKGEKNTNPWNKELMDRLNCHKHQPNSKGPAACCTAGHLLIWKQIVDKKECAVVFEHDSIMLHKPTFDVPDNCIVVLGYKVTDPENYKHEDAGSPQTLEDRKKHGGAHAYCLNHVTAETLLNNVRNGKRVAHIDNQFFLTPSSRQGVDMKIADPICALGWLRKSTIWTKSAVDNYGPILESFKTNYHSKADLGVKK